MRVFSLHREVFTANDAVIDPILVSFLLFLVVRHLLNLLGWVEIGPSCAHFTLLDHQVTDLLLMPRVDLILLLLGVLVRVVSVILALRQFLVCNHGGLCEVASPVNEGAGIHGGVFVILTLVVETAVFGLVTAPSVALLVLLLLKVIRVRISWLRLVRGLR